MSSIYTSYQIAALADNIILLKFQLTHPITVSLQTSIVPITTNIVLTIIVPTVIRVAIYISYFKFTITLNGTAQTLISTCNNTRELENTLSKLYISSIGSQKAP